MRPLELAQKHLYPYKTKGVEVVPDLCPYCGGGKSADKYTFSMNSETGAYNCKRGTCGVQGGFNDLLSHFGESSGKQVRELSRPKQQEFVAPKVATKGLSEKSSTYLKSRGISPEAWQKYGVKEKDGNLVFPYYEKGELVLVKYRKPEKHRKGNGSKAWREPGGKAVFWGMDLVEGDQLVITEGECDCLAIAEAGVQNVVSVPSGAEDLTCVENCWDWLEQFKSICIWPDNDKPGLEMARKLINKLGPHRCYIVQCEHKDANVALYREGVEAVREYVRTAAEVPMAGLLRLEEVEAFDLESAVKINSSLMPINRFVGGYMLGLLSVWTGVNSSGKSTYLSQEMVHAINQGYRVCAYSGEMPTAIFRYWVDLQAAGPDNVTTKYDSYTQHEVAKVKPEVMSQIRDWYKNRFFIYDSMGGVDDKSLFDVFTYAVRRYGCQVFLIDNLMLMNFVENDSDFYRQQSGFVKRLKDFARQHEVHVHLVAHPRKIQEKLTKMDVMGSGNITNIADNVFGFERVHPDNQQEENCDAYISLFKNRVSGVQDKKFALNFSSACKRFCTTSGQGFGWKYSWEGL